MAGLSTQNLEKTLTELQSLLEQNKTDALKEKAAELRKSDQAPTLSYFLNAIENERYDDAKTLLNDLIRQQRAVTTVFDPVVGALKVELNYQREELVKAEIERDELNKTIDLFHSRYFAKVRHLLEKTLYLRRDKLKIQVAQNPDMAPLLAEAEKELEEFREYQEESKDGVIYKLNDEKLRKLKRLYRKGSLICHPDRVKDEDFEKAQEVFGKLNKAYKRNDIKRVMQIVQYLEKTGGFDLRIDEIDNAEVLRGQIEQVMISIEDAVDEKELISNSTAYYTIKNIKGEWDEYFETIQENFESQIRDLEVWIKDNLPKGE